MPRLSLLALAAMAAVLAPAALAAPRGRPWATVNLCDRPAAPNSMGVRAGMPGIGLPRRMYMRFRAQYWSVSAHRWRKVRGALSPLIDVGSGRDGWRQAGFTFAFDAPPVGTIFLMRGAVDFQWRARKRGGWLITRRRRAVTRGGIAGVEGGDPPGASLASCLIQ